MSINKRLNKLLNEALKNEVLINDSSKIILFSDCHRGDNSMADDFAHNQELYFYALNDYYQKDFTYIEIGDGDELWENRKFENVRKAHSHIFWLMSKFYQEGRLYLVWGNHNRKWKNRNKVRKFLYSFTNRKGEIEPLFEGITVYESLVLRVTKTDKKILLVHGHQNDLINDQLWWFGRFFVRIFWRVLQKVGFKDQTGPAKNFRSRNKVEARLKKWCKENYGNIIAGHTHRSEFPKHNEPRYFNVGSCVHPRCITGIKIENGNISLIKWGTLPDSEGRLFFKEKTIEDCGPEELSTILI